jgi:acetyl esterase/lipase
LDIYIPPHISYPVPVVVWIHGGGWQGGRKENVNGTWLIQKGFAIVSINYRLTDVAIHPAQINDCKAAIRWVKANASKYHFDATKVGVFGSSAGGHLSALVGTSGDVTELEGNVGGNLDQSSRVKAACDWFGPTDFTICTGAPSSSTHCNADSPEGKLIGGDLRNNPDKCKSASPITYVSKDDPPFLIMHGTLDPTVPFQQSITLDSLYRSIGHDVTFIPQPGTGHGGGSFNADSTKQRVTDFFNRTLMGRTSVNKEVIPTSFKLFQNYPNPFNPETTIEYAVPSNAKGEAAKVTLKVYDLLGREVATIADEFKQAGNYRAIFNVETQHIASLPSGIYFYRLQSGGYSETKKLILMK